MCGSVVYGVRPLYDNAHEPELSNNLVGSGCCVGADTQVVLTLSENRGTVDARYTPTYGV